MQTVNFKCKSYTAEVSFQSSECVVAQANKTITNKLNMTKTPANQSQYYKGTFSMGVRATLKCDSY